MEKEKVQELLEYAATLHSTNMSIADIEKAMIAQGADEELAKKIVRTIDVGQRKEQSSKGKYFIMSGIGLMSFGIIITAISYFNADYGETYSIYWKLIAVGFFGLIGGLCDLVISKTKRD